MSERQDLPPPALPPHTDVSRIWATTSVTFLVSSHSWTGDNVRSMSDRLAKRTSLILFGNEGLRGWRKKGEAHNPSCLKSSVRFLQSVMIWGAMASSGVGPLFYQVQSQCSSLPRIFRALHASFCWQALWRCRFHFQQDLEPAHTAKSTNNWFTGHRITVLYWLAYSPDLHHRKCMGYC